MEKHIYFVRHGQSESNVDHIHRGRVAKLTEEGLAQARTVADRIERTGVNALLSSTFPRAAHTAAIIGEKIGLEPEQHECFGEWLEPSHLHGKSNDSSLSREVNKLINMSVDDYHFRVHDEETFAELVARGEISLRLLEGHSADRICVVTHGGFLRIMIGLILFRSAFTKREFTDMRKNFVSTNTGVTYVRHDAENGWRLSSLNDQSHLG